MNDLARALAIETADTRVLAAILALNNRYAEDLSWLDAARMDDLVSDTNGGSL